MSALVGSTEVNKFEQVSSDGYQMSPTEGAMGVPEVPCTGQGRGRDLYSEFQCIMGNPPVDRLTDGQTCMKPLPSHNFTDGR